MKTDWKALLVILLMAVAVIVFIYSQMLKEKSLFAPPSGGTTGIPKPTGKIDDVIGAISAFAVQEEKLLEAEDNEKILVESDSQALNNYLGIYDESDF